MDASSSSSSTSMALDLEAVHDFATDLAVRAGALLRQAAFSRSQAGYLPPPSASTSTSTSTSAASTATTTPDLDVRDKQSNVDIVTETDLRVEKFILDEIRARYPRHALLAEETYAAGGSKRFGLTDEPTWVVDPLDGTVNFLHLFPFVCVSIGFTVGKVPVVGAIYAPMLGGLDPRASGGTLWSSCQGRGAYQSYPSTTDPTQCSLAFLERYACSAIPRSPPTGNPAGATASASTSSATSADPSSSSSSSSSAAPPPPGPQPLRLPLQPTRPLSRQAPSGLLIASEWGKDRRGAPDGNLLRKANSFLNLAGERGSRGGLGGQAQGLRSMGSAALDLAFCASGAVDVFWEGGCWEWDVCAGLALLYEAGGVATEGNAPPLDSELWDAKKSGGRLPRPSLGARRFLCVRPCLVGSPAGKQGEEEETALQAQERVVRSIWERLHLGGLAYQRDGVEYAY